MKGDVVTDMTIGAAILIWFTVAVAVASLPTLYRVTLRCRQRCRRRRQADKMVASCDAMADRIRAHRVSEVTRARRNRERGDQEW